MKHSAKQRAGSSALGSARRPFLNVLLGGFVLLGACDIDNPEDARDGSVVLLDANLMPVPPGDGGGPSDASVDPGLDGGAAARCPRPDTSAAVFTRAALLSAAGQCAAWHHCEFAHVAGELDAQVRAYQANPSVDQLEAARDAWRRAMDVWSRIELLQYGPAASKAQDTYHGQGLRSRIYAWPNASRCRVEEQIASQAYLMSGIDEVLVDGRGLFAVEYALFYEGSDHACLPSSPTAARWPTFSSMELGSRKLAYAAAVSADIAAQARKLELLWAPEGANFVQTLASAAGYPSEQEALNVVAWGLVYVEKEVKDWKLGVPAGYSPMAPISGPEAPFAQFGTENIRANLEGFRALFAGCGPAGQGLGFDDWLIAAGHPELATAMLAALTNAEAQANAFPPLHTATPAELESLYRAVKALTDLLKNELFGPGSPLNLKLPTAIGSDTD